MMQHILSIFPLLSQPALFQTTILGKFVEQNKPLINGSISFKKLGLVALLDPL